MEVSIIIPVYNQLKYTQLCLTSIFQNTPESYEIIIIDNGSEDNTLAYMKQFPWIRLIHNDKNLGFAKAINQGLKLAQSRYLVVLNNDCIVTAEWLQRLIKASLSPRIGIVGVMSNFVSSPQQVKVEINSLQDIAFISKRQKEAYSGNVVYTTRVVGLCMLFQQELVNQIGGFDPLFGLGTFEDDDFCLRSMLLGYQNVIAQDVFIYHFGSMTFKLQKNLRTQLLRENWQKFKEKWELPMSLPLGTKNYWKYLDTDGLIYRKEQIYIPLSE